MAVILKQTHGVDQFCGYVISPEAQEFLTKQADISYDELLADHELHAQYRHETIDAQYIETFEKTYQFPNIWQYLYCDRKLMMSIGPKEETTPVIDPLYSHEDLIRVFQVRAKAIERMLKEQKPDCIIFISIGTLSHMLLFHIARGMGIRTYNFDFPRVSNRICISQDYRTLTFVKSTAALIAKNGLPAHERQTAQSFIHQFRTSGSLQLQYMEVEMNKQPKTINPWWTVKYLVTLTRNYAKNRHVFTYGITNQHPLRFVQQKITQRFRLWRGTRDLVTQPDYTESYVFYPLHYEPELATLALSPFHFDQIDTIRLIARSLPFHYKLYVKEHPAMREKRARSYYKELLKIPNVKLIDPSVKSFDLIRHAKLITTITGTVGWEACLLNKPVITFGDIFYAALPLVKRAGAPEDLPRLIWEQLQQTDVDYSTDIEHFVAAVLQESVPFDLTTLWYENDFQTLLANKGLRDICAKLMAYIDSDARI